MKHDISFGIIPLRKRNSWEVLLVKHAAHYWAFPKGHGEKGETPLESASRELFEEVGLKVHHFFSFSPLEEEYKFKHEGELIHKKVVYFLAEVEGEVSIQIEEILEAKWVELSQAESIITYNESKRLCRETIQRIQTLED